MVADVEATLAGEEPAGWAGQELTGGLATAARGLGRVPDGAEDLVHVFDRGVTDALEVAGRVRSQVDATVFALVTQALSRGLHTAVGMGLVNWVTVRLPWVPAAEVAHHRQVAEAAATHWGAPLGAAVREGRTGVGRAAKVARTLRRLAPALEVDQREAYAAIATAAACNPAVSDRDLAGVCHKLLVDLLDEPPDDHHADDRHADDRLDLDHHVDDHHDPDDPAGDGAQRSADTTGDRDGPGECDCQGGNGAPADGWAHDGVADAAPHGRTWAGSGAARGLGRRRERLRALRFATKRRLGNGLTRYTFDAPEDDAALFDAVLDGPLARPSPGPDGSPDLRSAGMRRYDARIAVLTRGLGHPGAPASSARASVILTVKADPRTGKPYGAAATQTGQVFPAAAAGRFACLGDLTPIVLGPYGEPLDLGRTQRLASPGQYKALLVRDERCVYPGCTIPGTWCEAHHLVWWSRGGSTDIAHLALLCQRHHTTVHDKDLTITVNGGHATVHV